MSKKFDSYLIVSDLDGTFFGENPKILPKNLEAVSYFTENGGVFTVATGRDWQALKSIFPNANEYLTGPAILCNGVYLYDYGQNKVLEESYLDKEEFLPLLKIIREKFPDVGLRISAKVGYICPHVSPFMETKIKSYLPLIIRSDLDAYDSIPWHKCVFVAEPEIIQEMWAFTKTLKMEKSTSLPSFPTLLEILPGTAGKATKLEKLKAFYPGRTTICVGDYTNDLDILSAADISACPENALDEVKSIAKIHLCHHRDGCIADLIYKLDSITKE